MTMQIGMYIYDYGWGFFFGVIGNDLERWSLFCIMRDVSGGIRRFRRQCVAESEADAP